MAEMEYDWRESRFFCTTCDQVVEERNGPNGFVMMRCQCVQKAGHREVDLPRGWIDRRYRGDERAIRFEFMHAEMEAVE